MPEKYCGDDASDRSKYQQCHKGSHSPTTFVYIDFQLPWVNGNVVTNIPLAKICEGRELRGPRISKESMIVPVMCIQIHIVFLAI
jgi:hypothetical protein